MRATMSTHQHRKSLLAAAVAVSALAISLPNAASAAQVTITSVRCWPAGACPGGLRVPIGGYLMLGTNPRLRSPHVRVTGSADSTPRTTRDGRLLIKIGSDATAGGVRVEGDGFAWSKPSTTIYPVPAAGVEPPRPSGSAFDGNGMWIWTLSATERGSLKSIADRAISNDITTVFVKSSDSDHLYPRSAPQFTKALVTYFHGRGIKVCAWPFVYGNLPKAEAAMTVEAVKRGADCVAIDAESEYEGKYAAAADYIARTRSAIGTSYPLSLAGLPYVDYHPSFPYSVFLGRGAAQFNQPQVYWRDIGSSVDKVLSHSLSVNAPYGRVIVPLGQTWQVRQNSELLRFRALSAAWGAPGVSWWDWQESGSKQWAALGSSLSWPPATAAPPAWVTVGSSSKGDLVLWAQQHLKAGKYAVKLNGKFDQQTRAAVALLQGRNLMLPTGVIDQPTWKLLLKFQLPLPIWARPVRPTPTSGQIHTPPPVNVASAPRNTTPIPDTASLSGHSEFRLEKRR